MLAADVLRALDEEVGEAVGELLPADLPRADVQARGLRRDGVRQGLHLRAVVQVLLVRVTEGTERFAAETLGVAVGRLGGWGAGRHRADERVPRMTQQQTSSKTSRLARRRATRRERAAEREARPRRTRRPQADAASIRRKGEDARGCGGSGAARRPGAKERGAAKSCRHAGEQVVRARRRRAPFKSVFLQLTFSGTRRAAPTTPRRARLGRRVPRRFPPPLPSLLSLPPPIASRASCRTRTRRLATRASPRTRRAWPRSASARAGRTRSPRSRPSPPPTPPFHPPGRPSREQAPRPTRARPPPTLRARLAASARVQRRRHPRVRPRVRRPPPRSRSRRSRRVPRRRVQTPRLTVPRPLGLPRLPGRLRPVHPALHRGHRGVPRRRPPRRVRPGVLEQQRMPLPPRVPDGVRPRPRRTSAARGECPSRPARSAPCLR